MKIMGYDHGTNYAGWAMMVNGKPIEYGIRDFTEMKMPFVLNEIYKDSYKLIVDHKPDVIALERPVHFKNANSVIALIGAYSMITLAALHNGIRIEEVRPSELKTLTGKGNADKETVAMEMQMLFDLDYDEIAIPQLYQRDDPKGKYKKGDIKNRLFDPADAIALCVTLHNKLTKGAA